MNRRPTGFSLSKAIPGFLQFKSAEGLSTTTIDSYEQILHRWSFNLGDADIYNISHKDIRNYLNYMRTEYTPQRITGNNHVKLSGKTIRNIWITLSSFFSWASDEFDISNPMKKVPAPKFAEPTVEPFSKEDIEALLKVCEYSSEADPLFRRKFKMRRPTAKRDKAIILMLLDTGLRASEFCSLLVKDVEIRTGKVEVKHGTSGGAKGGKGRIVYLGKVARKTLWRYLAEREDGDDPDAPLIVTVANRPYNKCALLQLINSLGKRAGIKKCYPHRFRHTFAITYLRSDGDVFTLQMLLGHSTLDMVKRYARLADTDLARVHKKASPVDNWRRICGPHGSMTLLSFKGNRNLNHLSWQLRPLMQSKDDGIIEVWNRTLGDVPPLRHIAVEELMASVDQVEVVDSEWRGYIKESYGV